MNKPRLIFMGTPDFAVPTLQALYRSGFAPELVITQPDRPKGRGRHLEPPPVKSTAIALGCEVFQPEDMSDPCVKEKILALAPDFFVVVAFGHLLSPSLLAIPRIAPINIHASLLPKYRGAAPIQRAIINGESETGVTTMWMDAGMDTGDILMAERTPIEISDTSQSLHDRLSAIGSELVLHTLRGMLSGRISPLPQPHSDASYAPMLKKEDGRIDWRLSASRISCLIRGVTPWPGAYAFHQGRRLKIYKSQVISGTSHAAPGTVLASFPDELCISTGDGILSILEVQADSAKRLAVREFLRGYPLSPGEILL